MLCLRVMKELIVDTMHSRYVDTYAFSFASKHVCISPEFENHTIIASCTVALNWPVSACIRIPSSRRHSINGIIMCNNGHCNNFCSNLWFIKSLWCKCTNWYCYFLRRAMYAWLYDNYYGFINRILLYLWMLICMGVQAQTSTQLRHNYNNLHVTNWWTWYRNHIIHNAVANVTIMPDIFEPNIEMHILWTTYTIVYYNFLDSKMDYQ